MSAVTCSHLPLHNLHLRRPPSFSRQTQFPHRSTLSTGGAQSLFRRVKVGVSVWEEKPYETVAGGKRSYFDEQDLVTFLDPPKELIPFDPTSYNPASYLCRKKIEDIPEERHHRLLHLLKPRLISRAWEIAGTRYADPKLAKKSASKLLSSEDDQMLFEFYNCRTSGGN